MLSLTNSNKQYVKINGENYELNLAYDNVLRWFELLDTNLSEQAKVVQTFLMFVGEVKNANADDYINVFQKVQRIATEHPYGNGEVTNKPITKKDAENQAIEAWYNRPFDYKIDAGAIYASFMYDYHIDLIEQQGKLSWYKFKSLLDNLSDKSPLMRIVQIRKTDMGQIAKDYKDNPKYIGAVTDQKDYYSLAQTPEERQARKDYELGKAMEQL